jgi:D-beta-D-heptose 7-phosphate kinase/D-beta-D-heptose 1-phosphate adenosyltransferase
MQSTRAKIKTRQELKGILEQLKADGKEIVFTNGCFDLLHPGHVHYLEKAKAEGDVLVVALNSDLGCVDFVTTFEEEMPQAIVEELIPHVLVKGGDWPIDEIVGRQIVESNGGRVVSIDFEREFSTSDIIERIRRSGSKSISHES